MIEKSLNLEAYMPGIPLDKYPELVDALGRRREDGFSLLEKYGLPQAKRVELPLDILLANFDEAVSMLPTSKYIFTFTDQSDPKKRIANHGYDKEALISIINSMEDISHYWATISEFYPNEYGGTIQFIPNCIYFQDPATNLLLEMKEGQQKEVSTGEVTPLMRLRRDEFGGFSFEGIPDENLRKMILYKLVALFVIEGDIRTSIRKVKFIPGHFEFIFIRRDENSPLEPLFRDARDEVIFHSINIDEAIKRHETI